MRCPNKEPWWVGPTYASQTHERTCIQVNVAAAKNRGQLLRSVRTYVRWHYGGVLQAFICAMNC